jgi:hypothetical protein
MNPLAVLGAAVQNSRVSKDHVTLRIAENYRIPLVTAQQRWAVAKSKLRKTNAEGDLFSALVIVDNLRTSSDREPQKSSLPIARRPLKQLTKPGSMPIKRNPTKT